MRADVGTRGGEARPVLLDGLPVDKHLEGEVRLWFGFGFGFGFGFEFEFE